MKLRKNKNKSNAYMKASVEMLEQAEDAIKSKYAQYKGMEDTMKYVLNEVEKSKDVLIRDAKKKGITEQDMKYAVYSKPNEMEVEKYKKHLRKRGVTDEQVRDKKNYTFEDSKPIECGKEWKTEEQNTSCTFVEDNCDNRFWKPKYDYKHQYSASKCEKVDYNFNNETNSKACGDDFYKQTQQYNSSNQLLVNTLETNPILNNRFLVNLSFGDTVIEPYLVRSFHDDIFIKNIHIDLSLDAEHIELEEALEKIFTSKKGGRLKFSILSPNGFSWKNTEYSIEKIISLVEPFYRYDDDGYIVYHLTLEYNIKIGDKSSNTFENAFNLSPIDLAEINKNGEKHDFSTSALSDRIRKINEKYQETSDSIIPKEPTFEFGDFETALEYFSRHLIGNKLYYHNWLYDDVEEDIVEKRPTIVVCSRACGMTTHMLAHSLAKIATIPFYKIWYATPYKQNVNHIFSSIVSDEVRNLKDFEYNRYDGTIKCKSRRSEIRLISVSQNVENIFNGKILPNEVIYDDMAFMPSTRVSEFINMLEEKEKTTGNQVKEICISTPSKTGSIFNFLAIIADKPIFIPWYKNPLRNEHLEIERKSGKYTNKWFEDMVKNMGEKNAEVELCCRLGLDETPTEIDDEYEII